MRSLLCCFALWLPVFSVCAGTPQEDEQDRLYVRCMAQRGVDPSNIQKTDIAFCLVEAGIETPKEELKKEKSDIWRNCVIGKAIDMDDGISPVTDIARAVIQLCPSEWRDYVASLAMPPSSKRKMANGLEQYGMNDGVQAVLLGRKVKRETKASSTIKN